MEAWLGKCQGRSVQGNFSFEEKNVFFVKFELIFQVLFKIEYGEIALLNNFC